MGPLSKVLAKPLWPIFETTLVGHIINQLEEKNFDKVFVNTHHLHQQVAEYLESQYPEVRILHEDPILDSAGAIVNCAHAIGSDEGVLYCFNGDNIVDLSNFELKFPQGACTLYSEKVDLDSNYNRFKLSNGRLQEIIKADDPRKAESDLTYSGISAFNLKFSKLWQPIRPLGIFKDFLDFRTDEVHVLPFPGRQIDLGIDKLYRENLLSLVARIGEWENFLIRYTGLKMEYLNSNDQTYRAPHSKRCLNFSGQIFEGSVSDAFLFDRSSSEVQMGKIHYRGNFY